MKTLKSIQITNIQVLKNVKLDNLPPTGIIQFYGDNSNGKSVILKVVYALVNNTIFSLKDRHDLINWSPDTPDWGEAIFVRSDGLTLKVHIALEASECYAELYQEDEVDKHRIYASSKMLPSYVQQFGFHTLPEYGISLNLADADEEVLFFKTKDAATYAVIDSALTDRYTLTGIEELKRVRQESLELKKNCIRAKENLETALGSLVVYDEDALEERKKKLQALLPILSVKLTKPKFVPIPSPPPNDLVVCDIVQPKLRPLWKLPRLYTQTLCLDRDSLMKAMDEYKVILEGRCPACQRPLYGGDHTC